MGRAAIAASTVALLALGACTLLLPADVQCATDDDCARRGGPLTGTTCVEAVCVGIDASAPPTTDAQVEAAVDTKPDTGGPFGCKDTPKPQGDPTKPVTLVQPIYNVVSGAPLVGLTSRLCSRVDPNCSSPAATLTTDGQGALTAKVFYGFEGFFELKGTEVMDSLIMSNPPLFGDSRRPPVPLPTRAVVDFYAQQVTGTSLDTTLGALLVRTTDCDITPLRGTTATVGSATSKTKLFFVYNNTPRTDVNSTNEEGALGFFNVPVGPALVTVTDQATGARIGQTSVVIRANFLSLVYLTPSP